MQKDINININQWLLKDRTIFELLHNSNVFLHKDNIHILDNSVTSHISTILDIDTFEIEIIIHNTNNDILFHKHYWE